MASLLKASGLHTFYNELSELPDGALLKAKNTVINKNGIIEPRSGFEQFGTALPLTSDRTKQVMSYKDRLLRHYDTTLQFDGDGSGTFSSFNGSYTEPESNLRIKGLEVNGNFYFTTNSGIKKISATAASEFSTASGYITNAGAVGALDLQATSNYTISGFFTANNQVGYRVTWAFVDANNNLIEGTASNRVVVINPSGSNSATVDLTFTVPSEVTSTDYFYRIYRSALSGADSTDPGDEMYLVDEVNITSAEIGTGEVSYNDIIPDDFRASGTPLYSNEVSGDGISQSNDQPPLAKDIALFKNSLFYANTKTKHRKFVSLLSTSAFQNLVISNISIANPTVITTTTNHGLVTGDTVYISGTDSTPTISESTEYTITVTGATTFTIPVNVTGAGSVGNVYPSHLLISDSTVTNKYYFVGRQEVTSIDFSGMSNPIDTTVDGKYFTINTANDDIKYYVWFDDTGSTTDPAVSGRTGIKVDLNATGSTTKADVATDTKAAIEAVTSDFTIVDDLSGTLTSTTVNNGNVTHTPTENIGASFSISVTTNGDGEDAANNHVLLSNLPTVSQQVDDTARSLVHIINRNSSEVINAKYLSGPEDIPGQMLFEKRSLNDVEFYVGVSQSALSNKFNPEISSFAAKITSISMADPTVITSNGHGLTSGDKVVIYDSDSSPTVDSVYTVTVLTANTFSIPVEVTSAGTTGFWYKASYDSDNEVSPNRLYYSKYQQPEAVPLLNYVDVGPKDQEIKRIIALRDSLFILKEDGVYRLSGQVAPNFTVSLLDDAEIDSPDTAAILGNQIYTLCNQGIAQISESGVQIISRPIEGDLFESLNANPNYTYLGFAVSYESDRSYMIWIPEKSSDTVATICYRYNNFTQTWTQWSLQAKCGIVNEKKLFLGPGDKSYIKAERKTFTRKDYVDEELTRSIFETNSSGTTLDISSVTDVVVNDVVVQTQYLTITQFNRLLRHLDDDPTVADTDYESLWSASMGNDMRVKLDGLATKLDNDSGVSDTNYLSSLTGTNDFPTLQSDFNIIVNKLNSDTGVFYTNYKTSSGTLDYEASIDAITINGNLLTIPYSIPFIQGACVVAKGIDVEVEWAPVHFGDPSMLKQVREGTVLFKNRSFSDGEISYRTDQSRNFDEISFIFPGSGAWGLTSWGEDIIWGGEGKSTPMRTYIPIEKQYCRYINCRFKHSGAREKFTILGISYEARVISSNAYR